MLTKIQRGWQRAGWLNRLLYPVSVFYSLIMATRGLLYRLGLKPSFSLPAPTIVVGNLSVGGTGKTPLVIALAGYLESIGYRPGIVTRGYKAESLQGCALVDARSTAKDVGDEALLIYQRCALPVMVGRDRVANGRTLVEEQGCNVILSDDGFAHFRLQRDIDVVVVDGNRGFGNAWCLPAGPLREPIRNLKRGHAVVIHGTQSPDLVIEHDHVFRMSLRTESVTSVDTARTRDLAYFAGQSVHAVAGIGHPERFFSQLSEAGITVIPHPFDDHHDFVESDLDFADDLAVLMTEKDAVKCRRFGASDNHWFVPVSANLDREFYSFIKHRLSP